MGDLHPALRAPLRRGCPFFICFVLRLFAAGEEAQKGPSSATVDIRQSPFRLAPLCLQ